MSTSGTTSVLIRPTSVSAVWYESSSSLRPGMTVKTMTLCVIQVYQPSGMNPVPASDLVWQRRLWLSVSYHQNRCTWRAWQSSSSLSTEQATDRLEVPLWTTQTHLTENSENRTWNRSTWVYTTHFIRLRSNSRGGNPLNGTLLLMIMMMTKFSTASKWESNSPTERELYTVLLVSVLVMKLLTELEPHFILQHLMTTSWVNCHDSLSLQHTWHSTALTALQLGLDRKTEIQLRSGG